MFRSKRSNFVKRLWKLNVLTEDETKGSVETQADIEWKSIIHSVLKRLSEKQLEILIESVESKGGETTDCVLLPKGTIKLGRRGSVEPHIMCCQIWRWPQVDHNHKLKVLPWCHSCSQETHVCCNPYHWSLLMEPESPPPPYSKEQPTPTLQTDTPQQGSWQDHERVDNSRELLLRCQHCTGESGVSSSQHREGSYWCNVAYWELRQRVGRLFTVVQPTVSIFQDLPRGDGMCLKILQEHADKDSVRRTRDKIGFGVVLFREPDCVWMYNRSSYPVFVNSPTLTAPNSRTLTVHKVSPGYSVRLFDFNRAVLLENSRDSLLFEDGPFDPNAVRISFAKGWGPCYSRQFITSCPCWLEVLLKAKR